MGAVDPLRGLSADQQAWVVDHEALWRRAAEIALRHPGMDVAGVYHVLCNLRRSPSERLRRTLGRLRPDAR
jgi:hypothetical protein